ncbi:hypothetical protein JXA56_02465 [Candidatus Micrarchaeota archaeon]|nr:hypothetical protein [Candidatus Micrarchaeota archaeon]
MKLSLVCAGILFLAGLLLAALLTASWAENERTDAELENTKAELGRTAMELKEMEAVLTERNIEIQK